MPKCGVMLKNGKIIIENIEAWRELCEGIMLAKDKNPKLAEMIDIIHEYKEVQDIYEKFAYIAVYKPDLLRDMMKAADATIHTFKYHNQT